MSPWADEMFKLATAKERWLEVEAYKSRKGAGELFLKARGKRLWFPMSESAYAEFKSRLKGSQADALAFARSHVRSGAVREPYNGMWEGAGSRYHRRNRLPVLLPKRRWDVSGARRVFEDEAVKTAKARLLASLWDKAKGTVQLGALGGLTAGGIAGYVGGKHLLQRLREGSPYARPIQYGRY